MDARLVHPTTINFDHFNIINFVNRPFRKVKKMNEFMINGWNKVVSNEDTIYFLGDFAFGPDSNDTNTVKYLKSLNGNIKFLLGNHDEAKPQFGCLGIEQLIIDNKLDIEVIPTHHQMVVESQIFELSHYKPKHDIFPKNKDIIYLHGHMHHRFKYTKILDFMITRTYDIGIDMYGGPVEITGDLRYLNNPTGWIK